VRTGRDADRSWWQAVWLAWLGWALCVALTGAGLLLAWLNRGSFQPFDPEGLSVAVAIAVVFFGVGALLAARRPANSIGWVMLAGGLSQSAQLFGAQYGAYAVVARSGQLPGGELAAWTASWLTAPGYTLTWPGSSSCAR
jgi:hypothetical protein